MLFTSHETESPLFSKARAAVLPSDELMAAGKPRKAMRASGNFRKFASESVFSLKL